MGAGYLNGRRLFPHEKTTLPQIDPAFMNVAYPLEGLPNASETQVGIEPYETISLELQLASPDNT